MKYNLWLNVLVVIDLATCTIFLPLETLDDIARRIKKPLPSAMYRSPN